MKEFADRNGSTWRVWSTKPTNPKVVAPGFEQGWLTFESVSERRRLAPTPDDWETADADRLQLWCRAATPVSAA